MKYSKEELIKMYDQLLAARIYADKMEKAVLDGQVLGSLHLPHGQEAIGIATVNAMRDTDWISPTHRFQAALMNRFDIQEFTDEILGKVTGTNKGITFDFHNCDYENARILQPVGTLGALVPIAAGHAWQRRRLGYDEVVIAVHGDGGCAEGTVAETWNLAALFNVPVVFLIENNGWAEGTPSTAHHFNAQISDKAAAAGIERKVVDGNDLLAMREAMEWAIETARTGKPTCVEAMTLRWKGHYCGEPGAYRTEAENARIEDGKKNNCPLLRYEEKLLTEGLIDEKYVSETRDRIDAELEDVFKKAYDAPYPTFEEVIKYDWIYADPTTGGEL